MQYAMATKNIRGGSRAAAAYKMELFMIIVIGFQLLSQFY